MLKPYEMDSVLIAGPNSVQEKVIKELHKLKILHIVDHSKNEMADIGKPLENSNKLSELIVKVRALITALNISKEGSTFELKRGMLEIELTTKKLNEEVRLFTEQLKRTEDLISKTQAAKQELNILENINIPLENFTSYKSLAYFTGHLEKENNVKILKEELSKTTKKFMLFHSIVEKRAFIVLFIDAKIKEQANNILKKINFSPVNFANIENLRGTAKTNLIKIGKEITKLENHSDNLKKRLGKLGNEYKDFLLTAEEILSQELERAEAPLKFAATSSSFLIKGWIPTEQLNETIERLNKAGKNKLFIQFQDAKKGDKVPVKLKNAAYVKPFEFFINLYSMPTYKEIDPTFFIFLTFPIFFGFMLGDIGYGIVSFGLFWLLKKKFPKAKNIFNVMLLASAVSIVFGFLYGEIFGLEEIGEFHLWHVLSRVHEIITLLIVAIGIGVVHVNIGLIIGFINKMRAHGLSKAIFEKGSWFVLQIGVALLALSSFNIINLSSIFGYLFILIAILMLLKGEGIKGIIELPGIFTNILSYARLMAIGLSSVSLALLINESAAGLFHKGGFSILIAVLLLIVGHVFNIVLGLFGSFLHSLRLHYVEFFGKFFDGGAEKYRPFGLKE